MTAKFWNLNALSVELGRRVVEHIYAPTPDAATGELDLDQERARHAKEQADKLALENAVSREELVYTEDMAEVMGRALAAFRARLRAIPKKFGGRLPPQLRASLVDRLETMINEALAELADFDPDKDPVTPPRKNGSKHRR